MKKLSIAFVFMLLFGIAFNSSLIFANGEDWVKKSDLPAPRMGSAVATLDGKIYVFGGASDSSFCSLRS
ncbi:hypothetical protein EHV15_04330 [Paenibacillus oralis]|uniref:Galactose oxidase n=1 Tax=Paenibacillus oralis TaxID=2490856 RepID=A0A3P3TVY6_9BACL|nr:hypothetical protein [Paenibacillus oralis]RRJ62262.1 hypothetical protein EHV15_04330 [Paenibacillus oralis]